MNHNGQHADNPSRRAFIKKTAYVAPLILTLKAAPAFASQGSGQLGSVDYGAIEEDAISYDSLAGSTLKYSHRGPVARQKPRRDWWWFLASSGS
jgi:hypothetical protein